MNKEEDISIGPERKTGGFGVIMKYNPEFVYTVLDRSYKSKAMILNNNWESIYEKGYDLFEKEPLSGLYGEEPSTGIWTSINCDLKVKTYPDWPDRSSKVFDISTVLVWPYAHSEWRFLTPRLQTELLSTGLDFDLTSILKDNTSGTNKFLISKNLDLPITIEHWSNTRQYRGIFSTSSGIKISLSHPSIDLTSPDDIRKSMDLSASVLEKTIGALYKMYNKRLPLQKLVFEPRESESTEKTNVASCTYCSSFYSIVYSLTCPHCGASNPRFTT